MNSLIKKYKSKAVSLIAAGIVTISAILLPTAAAHADAPPAAPSMSLDLNTSSVGDIQSSRTVGIGEVFDVDLWIELSSGYASAGAAAQVTWDPAVLQCNNVIVGAAAPYLYTVPPFSVTPPYDWTTTPGQVNNTGPSSFGSTATGHGVVARYTFQAIGAGSANLAIVGGSISNNDGTNALLQGTDFIGQGASVTVEGPKPDLIVLSKSETWIDPVLGTYNVNCVIKNQGAAAATGFSVDVYKDGSGSSSDSEAVAGLAAGASTPTLVLGPLTIDGGVDEITVVADSGLDVDESDETNNSLTNTFAAYAMTVNAPTNANLYSTFNVDVEITVPGGFISQGAATKLTFDKTKLQCLSLTVGTSSLYKYPVPPAIVLGPLAPDLPNLMNGGIDNSIGQIEMTGLYYPTGADNTTSKVMMRLQFKALSTGAAYINLVDPSLTDDIGTPLLPPTLNVYNDTVNVIASALPDLIIENKYETWVDEVAKTYNVTFTIKNIGGGAADAPETNQCGIYIDGNLVTLAQFLDPFPAGANQTITKGPFTMTGTYDEITVIADNLKTITEGDEDNNSVTNIFGLPDIVVNWKGETWISQGTTYNVNFTVENTGDALASEFAVTVSNGVQTKEQIVVGGLEAGGKRTYTAGPFTLDGLFDIITITADIYNSVYEYSELNNVKQNLISYESDACFTDLYSNILPDIEITCPTDVDNWQLTIGINQVSGTLNVKSNAPWQCDAADNNAKSNGYMTEWNGSDFVSPNPEKLSHAMIVICAPNSVVLAGPGMICSGDTSGQNGNLGENFAVTFQQEVEWADTVLTNGNIYYIRVSFNAGVTF